MIKNNKIAIIGSGHGSYAAYRSLANFFSSIDIVTDDKNLIEIKRGCDIVVESIEKSEAKVMVCAGYSRMIPKGLLKDKVFINTHPSLLPKYRGRHSLVWAILNGEQKVGFTIHLINEFMDDGPIIDQYAIEYNGQTSKNIMDEFDRYIEINLGRIIHEYLLGNIEAVNQDRSKATWVPKRNLRDCLVDFSKPIDFHKLFFKALVKPYPHPLISVKGTIYEILKHRIIETNYYAINGAVVNVENEDVYIKINGGILIINELIDLKNNFLYSANLILKVGMRL